jgi:hypothetical protein
MGLFCVFFVLPQRTQRFIEIVLTVENCRLEAGVTGYNCRQDAGVTDFQVLEGFEDGCGDAGGEGCEDRVLLAAVFCDVAGQGVLGAMVHVLCKWVCFAEIVFECSIFGGAGVALEGGDGDVPGRQRLVEGVEQVLAGKEHFSPQISQSLRFGRDDMIYTDFFNSHNYNSVFKQPD